MHLEWKQCSVYIHKTIGSLSRWDKPDGSLWSLVAVVPLHIFLCACASLWFSAKHNSFPLSVC